jgi:hypothetical protein
VYGLVTVTVILVLAVFGVSFAAMKLAQNTDFKVPTSSGPALLVTRSGQPLTLQGNGITSTSNEANWIYVLPAGDVTQSKKSHGVISSILGVEMFYSMHPQRRLRVLDAVTDTLSGYIMFGTISSSIVQAGIDAGSISMISITATIVTPTGTQVSTQQL